MTMSREEIRRAALAIHELRKFKNRSAASKRRVQIEQDRGYFTRFDYDGKNRRVLAGGRGIRDTEPVDYAFERASRTGMLPRGSWS